ncbi:MAG TPA: AMP-binding protein [Dongiaceae bacterium]|nr:AMP-binding protein [Dongiaceae bacterium]
MDPLIILKTMLRTWELKKHDRSPLAETLEIREAAVKQLIQFARASSPFYAEFHQGYEGAPLAELPVLTKATMMERFDELVTDRQIRLADVERHLDQLSAPSLFLGRYRVCSTSGSTGRRGFFVFDRDEWVAAIASFRRSSAWCGVGIPMLFPPMAMIASAVPWHMTAQVGSSLRLPWVRMKRFDAAGPLEILTQRLNDLRPRFVATYPSVGRALAMEQLEGRLAIEPRVVFTGSEVLTPAVRALMEQAWGRERVFDHYGATETGSIAAECSRHRLHMAEDLLVVEGVDRENRPVPPGIASEKLLVTVLFRRTQPLIRYEISDRVVFSSVGCDCGLPWRVLERVEGRDEEMLRLPAAGGGAREVHPVVFEGILDNLPIAGWQVTSGGNDVTVLLAGADGIDSDAIREKILEALEKRGVVPASVTVRKVAELSRTATGKASHVRMASGYGQKRL